jgi:hypothetical protein
MEHEQDEIAPERVEQTVARIRALDTPAPTRLRAAVEALVADAEARERTAPRDEAAPGAPAPRAAAAAGTSAQHDDTAAAAGKPARSRPWLRRPFAWAGGAVAALAVVALLLVLVLSGGSGGPGTGTGTPSVEQVAAVALQPPSDAAPAALPGGRLAVSGDGIPFPDWSGQPGGGWRATGTRSERVGDRDVTTVVYADDAGRRVGYAIAEAPALPLGGRAVERNGVPMWVYELDGGGTAVMWLRDGRTCVVAARGVDAGTLLDLAAPRMA